MTQKTYRLCDPKDHILGITILSHLPINLGRNPQVLGVFNQITAHDPRTVGSPTVETFAEGPLAAAVLDLPVSVGDVVAD
jgi:hypothetical protein